MELYKVPLVKLPRPPASASRLHTTYSVLSVGPPHMAQRPICYRFITGRPKLVLNLFLLHSSGLSGLHSHGLVPTKSLSCSCCKVPVRRENEREQSSGWFVRTGKPLKVPPKSISMLLPVFCANSQTIFIKACCE